MEQAARQARTAAPSGRAKLPRRPMATESSPSQDDIVGGLRAQGSGGLAGRRLGAEDKRDAALGVSWTVLSRSSAARPREQEVAVRESFPIPPSGLDNWARCSLCAVRSGIILHKWIPLGSTA